MHIYITKRNFKMFSLKVLVEQGLGKYVDPDFIRYTSREMQEALDMTSEEMDMAAHQLMLQNRSPSNNPVNNCIPDSSSNAKYSPQKDKSYNHQMI